MGENMANFQTPRPLSDQTTWTRQSHYSPVDQTQKHSGHVTVLSVSTPQQLSRKESFRPLAHRTFPLILLATIVLGLVAALEYSVRVLPSTSFDLTDQVSNITSHVNNITLAKRQEGDSTTTDTLPGAAATTFPTGVPPSDSFLNAAATSVGVPHTTSDVYNPGDGTTIEAVLPTDASVGNSAPAASPQGTPVPSGQNPGVGVNTAGTGVSPGAGANSVPSAGLVTVTGPSTGSAAPSMYMNPTGTTGQGTAPTDTAFPGPKQKDELTLQSNVPLLLVKDPKNYFLGVYVPVLVAVLVRLFAGYLYRCTKLMDPFFMLSEPAGAPIHHFLWVDHLSSDSILAPWYAFQARRWTLLWAAVLYASTQLLTPFASELTSIQLSKYDFQTASTVGYVRGHALWVNSIVIRILQAILTFVFIQIVNVWILLRKNKSGVRVSPASIATMASLVGHPCTAADFSRVDQYADKKSTIENFGNQSYRLESFIGPDSSECYGIVPVGQSRPNPLEYDPTNSHHFTDEPSRSIGRKDTVNLLGITASAMALLGLIVAYTVNSASTPFELFMDSQSFGPRFILSMLALIVKSPLLSLCARTTASVPFARLASRPQGAKLDIIAPVPLTPVASIGYALRRRAWFAASLGVAAGVLVEILLVLLPGVPFEAQQFYQAAEASWFGSIALLGLILLISLAGWIRLFITGGAQWPKSPTTIGAIAMYVAGTSLASDASVDGVSPLQGPLYEFSKRNGRWVVDYADLPNNSRDSGLREKQIRNSGMSRSGYWGHRESHGVVSFHDDHVQTVNNVGEAGYEATSVVDNYNRDPNPHESFVSRQTYSHVSLRQDEFGPRDTYSQISNHLEQTTSYGVRPAQGNYPGRPRYRSLPEI